MLFFPVLLFRASLPLLASQGDESCADTDGKALTLYGVVDPGPSEHFHGSSKRKKEQLMQRNRQLYRSNPNMTSGCTSLTAAGHLQ